MLLYHYTDIHGLLGILQNKKIWASPLQHMNDKLEGVLATQLLSEYLGVEAQRAGGEVEAFMPVVSNYAVQNLKTQELYGTYVFSLSEKPDLLSQWRGYTPNGGYCIGFRKEAIQSLADENNLLLGPCCYDYEKNAKNIKDALDDYVLGEIQWPNLSEMHAKDGSIEKEMRVLHEHGVNISGRMKGKSALMKHFSFAEEAEWRLYGAPDPSGENVRFRASGPYVRPYIELDIEQIPARIEGPVIEEILVAPGMDPRMANDPLYELASRSGLGVTTIKNSSSSFRR